LSRPFFKKTQKIFHGFRAFDFLSKRRKITEQWQTDGQ
jgi:hypothetical protein